MERTATYQANKPRGRISRLLSRSSKVSQERPRLSWFHHFANWALRHIYPILTHWHITGTENIPPTGALIVIGNHIHLLDPTVIGAVLGRPIVFLAKEQAYNSWYLGPLVRNYGAIPIRRGTVDRTALKRASAVLDAGLALGILPEGHRSATAQMQRGHLGAAILAIRSGAPVLPIGLAGVEQIVPALKRGRRANVTINIGPTFKPTLVLRLQEGQPLEKMDKETLFGVLDEMMFHVAALLPPAYRGVYSDPAHPPTSEPPEVF